MTEPLIHDRYRIVRRIGRGAQGATYLADDELDGRQVALKELDFAGVQTWDAVSLFEREAAVLGGLTHAHIPRIIESFREEAEGELRLFLVQEYVEGKDLQQRLADGELFDERRLRAIARSVLESLVYIHRHSPPVLHRDVKPANLIERPDGEIALVDFGAAQGSQQGEAVIGTTGYMPAEQLMGRAQPSSDLFALGATLIHLSTRKHPADLGEGLGLRWKEYANLSPKFTSWLDRMVAPMPEDRFPSAIAAQRALADDTIKRKKRALARRRELDDLLAEDAKKTTTTKNGRFTIARGYGKIVVTSKKSVVSKVFVRWVPRLLVGVIIVCFAFSAWTVIRNLHFFGIALLFAAMIRGVGRLSPLVKQIEGHDRGIDIVWAGEEVVQRVLLDDISGPDLEKIPGGHALVLWRRDGTHLTLDRQLGSAADARLLRAILQAWLAQVRRRR